MQQPKAQTGRKQMNSNQAKLIQFAFFIGNVDSVYDTKGEEGMKYGLQSV